MTQEPSDTQLLQTWCAGDRDAGNALFQRYFAGLFRFFESKVGGDADELLQRTFLACAENRSQIRDPARFRSYLFTIARNELFRFFRQRSAAREQLDFGVTTLSDLRTSVTGKLVRAERQEALQQALARMPLDDQILIELFYVEELDSRALSEIIGIEPSSVRARLHRARRELESMLLEHVAEKATRNPSGAAGRVYDGGGFTSG